MVFRRVSIVDDAMAVVRVGESKYLRPMLKTPRVTDVLALALLSRFVGVDFVVFSALFIHACLPGGVGVVFFVFGAIDQVNVKQWSRRS